MEQHGAWGEKNMYGKISSDVIRSVMWIGADAKAKALEEGCECGEAFCEGAEALRPRA